MAESSTTTITGPLPEPVTEAARRIRAAVSPEKWSRMVADAHWKLDILERVVRMNRRTGRSRRKSLLRVAPEVGWSRLEHWRRSLQARTGPAWESLLDHRLPPKPPGIPSEVAAAAVAFRQVDPTINCEVARGHLVARFGELGRISDSSLRTIWRDAGLTQAPDAARFDKVEAYHGGGAMALLAAAEVETDAVGSLAGAALEAGQSAAASQEPAAEVVSAGRDKQGHFTADYNRAIRLGVEVGEPDSRWVPDSDKAKNRVLQEMQLLTLSKEAVAQRLMAIGLLPLLTERRGFDGLDGPRGEWLEVIVPTAYQPATLDKTLQELAQLGVGEALWHQHGANCSQLDRKWGGENLRWIVLYVDGTGDPHWTSNFALSGKVSRVGRVMPCLSRLAVMGGCGIPMLVALSPGALSLSKNLLGLLDEADRVLGPDQVGRMTVVDAEAANVALLSALATRPGYDFVTVLKGAAFRGDLENVGEWEALGERDRIRSGWLTIHGEGAPATGLRLRVVERERVGSRNPHVTRFCTTATEAELTAAEVVSLYLSRWPNQEQHFRDARNGGGLDRSHGFSGQQVSHVALDTKLDEAARKVERAEAALDKANILVQQTQVLTQRKRPSAKSKSAATNALQLAEKDSREKKKALENAQAEHRRLSTMPREIYKRDVTRENIVTAVTTTILMLVEFVLREYFGGLKMEYRTFIEHFVHTPTVVRSGPHRLLFQLEANRRNPKRTDQLRQACSEISRRKIKKGKQLLVFEVVEKVGQIP